MGTVLHGPGELTPSRQQQGPGRTGSAVQDDRALWPMEHAEASTPHVTLSEPVLARYALLGVPPLPVPATHTSVLPVDILTGAYQRARVP